MKQARLFLFLALALLLPRSVLAAPGAADATRELPMSARFTAPQAEAGTAATLELRFSLPRDARLKDPVKPRGLADKTVLGIDKAEGGLDARLLVDSLDVFEAGPVFLDFDSPDGGGAFKAEPARLTVTTSLGDNPSALTPRPALGIIPGVPGWKKYGPWALFGLFAAALAGCGAVWMKRHRARLVEARVIPADEEALARLNSLRENMDAGRLEAKEYYFQLSEILRTYMERLRGFPALEMTVEEIASKVSDARDRAMVPLLREADMVKFAGKRPMAARLLEDFDSARSYVLGAGGGTADSRAAEGGGAA
jgi:hypothetical protein